MFSTRIRKREGNIITKIRVKAPIIFLNNLILRGEGEDK
jgi:hypothetical protein